MMSANNIVVFEEQANGTFNAYHRDMDCWCEGQYADDECEPSIFQAVTMRDCVEGYEEWLKMNGVNNPDEIRIVEYGYVFELRADNRADPS